MKNITKTRQDIKKELVEFICQTTGRNDISIDHILLDILLDQWTTYKRAQADVEKRGFLIESESQYGTTKKANPANEVVDKSLNKLLILMREFELTPKSRTQLLEKIDEDFDVGSRPL